MVGCPWEAQRRNKMVTDSEEGMFCPQAEKRTKSECCQLKGQELSWEEDPCSSHGVQGNALLPTDQHISRHA